MSSTNSSHLPASTSSFHRSTVACPRLRTSTASFSLSRPTWVVSKWVYCDLSHATRCSMGRCTSVTSATFILAHSSCGTAHLPMRLPSPSTNSGLVGSSPMAALATRVSKSFWLGCSKLAWSSSPNTLPLWSAHTSRSMTWPPALRSDSSSLPLALPVCPATTCTLNPPSASNLAFTCARYPLYPRSTSATSPKPMRLRVWASA
mmetsp:Transcript_22883/g.77878  ORF Transcript_22883/g.77878 Transcript_22883/m.77878 type:complete len:204 (-) Transcript_22883:517-1128(-)